MSDRAPPTPYCHSHCCRCGRHFAGVKAFDLHRPEGYCREPEDLRITGRDRHTRRALQPWTHEGRCRLGDDCYHEGRLVRVDGPVTIWQEWQSPAQRAALERLRAS